jgi:hypothetical protein
MQFQQAVRIAAKKREVLFSVCLAIEDQTHSEKPDWLEEPRSFRNA